CVGDNWEIGVAGRLGGCNAADVIATRGAHGQRGAFDPTSTRCLPCCRVNEAPASPPVCFWNCRGSLLVSFEQQKRRRPRITNIAAVGFTSTSEYEPNISRFQCEQCP